MNYIVHVLSIDLNMTNLIFKIKNGWCVFMKKVFSLVLVLILMLTMISGCKKGPEDSFSGDYVSSAVSIDAESENVSADKNVESQNENKDEGTVNSEMVSSDNNSKVNDNNTSSNNSSKVTNSENTSETSSETKVEQRKKVCALTFDDGPSNITPKILDILEKYNCTASFFVIGKNIQDEDIPILKRAYEMGCTIENHTWNHNVLTNLPSDQIENEYKTVQEKVYSIVGEYPLFFRATGLQVNPTVYNTIPLTFISGTSGSNDWDINLSSTTKLNGILKTAKDGHIFLLHDSEGNDSIVEALDKAIPMLISQGYELVNIRELFNRQNQELTPDSHRSWSDVPYFIKD